MFSARILIGFSPGDRGYSLPYGGKLLWSGDQAVKGLGCERVMQMFHFLVMNVNGALNALCQVICPLGAWQ
jgi:hypothetical protein